MKRVRRDYARSLQRHTLDNWAPDRRDAGEPLQNSAPPVRLDGAASDQLSTRPFLDQVLSRTSIECDGQGYLHTSRLTARHCGIHRYRQKLPRRRRHSNVTTRTIRLPLCVCNFVSAGFETCAFRRKEPASRPWTPYSQRSNPSNSWFRLRIRHIATPQHGRFGSNQNQTANADHENSGTRMN